MPGHDDHDDPIHWGVEKTTEGTSSRVSESKRDGKGRRERMRD